MPDGTPDLFAELPVPRAVIEAETSPAGVVIHVPGHPKGKGRARSRFIKRRDGSGFISTFTDEATREYEATVAGAGQAAMNGRAPFAGALAVEIVARFPIPQSFSKKKRAAALEARVLPTVAPDWDNVAKAVLDGLAGIAFANDKQVAAARVVKLYALTPGITILVKPIGAAP